MTQFNIEEAEYKMLNYLVQSQATERLSLVNLMKKLKQYGKE